MEKYKNVMEICLEDEKKHMEKCDKIWKRAKEGDEGLGQLKIWWFIEGKLKNEKKLKNLQKNCKKKS
jgi:ferritin